MKLERARHIRAEQHFDQSAMTLSRTILFSLSICIGLMWLIALPFCIAAKMILRWQRLLLLCALFVSVSGCASYSKTGSWAPNGANYTISRDRQTGDLTDYFGLSWQFK